jgi:integrase
MAKRKPTLVERAVKAKTARRYAQRLILLRTWAKNTSKTLALWKRAKSGHGRSMDKLLMGYFQAGFDGQAKVGGYSGASKTLCAVLNKWPQFKAELPCARRSVKAWTRSQPSKKWPPLTLELAVMIALVMAAQGWMREAVGTLLAFDCMLRVSELCGLRGADVAYEHHAGVGAAFTGMGLSLRKTKTGDDLYVEVLRPDVILLVRDLQLRAGPKGRLLGCTTAQYRRRFHRACELLAIRAVGFVPHSLRHGGATHSFAVLRMPIESVMMRGRWASTKSARHYIQAGIPRILRATNPLLATLQARGAVLLRSLRDAFGCI